jgi:hypothetical protein
MSIVSTAFGLAKSAGSALIPGIGPALKFGPYVGAALLFGLLMFEHQELLTAKETIRADAATCSSERQADAAALTAKAQAVIDQQRAALDAVQESLQRASTANAAWGAALQANNAALASKPGQDAPLSPVFQSGLAALRAGVGQ